MEKPIRIVYTNEAKERLEKLMDKFRSDIEFSIKDMRYIPGDKLIEITGSDIEMVSKYFKFTSPDKIRSRNLIVNIYLIVGTISIMYGLFYNEFINLLEHNPIQLMLILLGITMISVGLWLKSILNRKKYKYNAREPYFSAKYGLIDIPNGMVDCHGNIVEDHDKEESIER